MSGSVWENLDRHSRRARTRLLEDLERCTVGLHRDKKTGSRKEATQPRLSWHPETPDRHLIDRGESTWEVHETRIDLSRHNYPSQDMLNLPDTKKPEYSRVYL